MMRAPSISCFSVGFLVVAGLFSFQTIFLFHRNYLTDDDCGLQHTIVENNAKTIANNNNANVPPPIWSAASYEKRRHLSNESSSEELLLEWRIPGKLSRQRPLRAAKELMTYGLAGVLPYYANILPALRLQNSAQVFTNTTRVEIALVPNIVDLIPDLQECSTNGDGTSVHGDGTFNVCYAPPRDPANSLKRVDMIRDWGSSSDDNKPTRKKAIGKHEYLVKTEHINGWNVGSAEDSYHHCYIEGHRKGHTFEPIYKYHNRKHDFPSVGHERWSCGDRNIMEQLVALQVLDVLIDHTDRFATNRTTNIFMQYGRQPVTFVSIDHESSFYFRYFDKAKTMAETKAPLLLAFDLPSALKDDLRKITTKSDFATKFNATIWGQLDNLDRVIRQIGVEELGPSELRTREEVIDYVTNYTSVVDTLWNRVQTIIEHYNITN